MSEERNLRIKDMYTKQWIIENAKSIIQGYPEGMTVRQLHYRLVSIGMTNDDKHYHKVCVALKDARWDNIISMEAFIDRERAMFGETASDVKELDAEIEEAKHQVKAWMNNYSLDRWSNQVNYIEVWIEKKALQGVFESPCEKYDVGLAPCKGYPSLTFLNDARKRFEAAQTREQTTFILYFGDYDPSGEDIPRSIRDNLLKMGCDVEVERIALHPEQIEEFHLVGVPPKIKDTRTNAWDGESVVELDAVDPKILREMCEKNILVYFDEQKYQELMLKEDLELGTYQDKLREFVNGLSENEGGL